MATTARYLDLPWGRPAYGDAGTGPMIAPAPAMLDRRAESRFIAPRLVAAGFRAVPGDPRGIGNITVEYPEEIVAAMTCSVQRISAPAPAEHSRR